MTFRLSTTEEYLGWLFLDNGAVELRHHDRKRWVTGWFDDPEAMLRAARARSRVGNLYTSLNAPKPRRVSNAMAGPPLKDEGVGWITRIPFDFDPARPTGVCSTDDEMVLAYDQRDRLANALHAIGWPVPMIGKSGNGYHAQYRTRLPNNAETREMLRAIYYGLHGEFNTPDVEFDRTVRNTARIFRLYGSINRKGENLPHRPWRQSTVWIPSPWRQVTARQVEQLASAYAKRLDRQREQRPVENHAPATHHRGKGDYRSLDIASWFSAHGLYKRPLSGGKHAVICLWGGEHSTSDTPNGTDTVVWETDGGWPTFHCSHAHCIGRGIRDVMALFGDADAFCSTGWTKEGGR